MAMMAMAHVRRHVKVVAIILLTDPKDMDPMEKLE